MSYRRFLSWLRVGPQIVKWEQGKGELPMPEAEKADAKALGL